MIARSARTILFLLLVLTAACSCLARGGPPLITDDPATPGNRHWEINLGITAQTLEHETDFDVPLLDVNYGAGDRVQLKLEIPYAAQMSGGTTRTGLGNTKLGMKWRWVDEDKHGFAFSTYPQLTFNNPTSSVRRGLAESGWQMLLPMELSKTLGKFEIDGELGYNVQQQRANEIWLGLIGESSPRSESSSWPNCIRLDRATLRRTSQSLLWAQELHAFRAGAVRIPRRGFQCDKHAAVG